MTIIDATTVSVIATYDEPTLNQDGTPLTDLAYTEVEYQLGASPSEILEPRQPASKVTGGGHIVSAPLVLPAPSGVSTTFTFNVFAVDLTNNRGPASPSVVSVIDRVGPAAPASFTIG